MKGFIFVVNITLPHVVTSSFDQFNRLFYLNTIASISIIGTYYWSP